MRVILGDFLHDDMRYKDRLLALAAIAEQEAVGTLPLGAPDGRSSRQW